jgi:two-component system cell cycle response regulator CpdR
MSDVIPLVDTRILIVEDEPGVRDFVKRGLLSVGYDVTAVEDAEQALDKLAKNPFQLMLTDIVMPGMDGISLSLKAAKDYPDLKILLMTGYANERQRAHNLDTLIHTVLPKPFSLKALIAAVEEALMAGRTH